MSDIVTIRRDDAIAIVALNSSFNRNALSVEMRQALTSAFAAAHADPAIRAIVLTGSGGTFCAGGDMKNTVTAASEPPEVRTPRLLRLLHDLVRQIACGSTPVIAAVDGDAFGAGLSLVTACDYIVAGPTARFCAVFGRVGLFPDAGLNWSLPNRIGVVRARQMVLTCDVVDAATALDDGLVDEIAEEGGTVNQAIDRARRFTKIAPLAAARVRAEMGVHPPSLEAAFATEMAVQPVLTASADYAEARAAFAAKRPPQFTGA